MPLFVNKLVILKVKLAKCSFYMIYYKYNKYNMIKRDIENILKKLASKYLEI